MKQKLTAEDQKRLDIIRKKIETLETDMEGVLKKFNARQAKKGLPALVVSK